MRKKKAAVAEPVKPRYINPYPTSGFYHPPVVASTGNEDIDDLVTDYNIAVFLRGGSSDPADYILATRIITEGYSKPMVEQTFANQKQASPVDNFEAMVIGFINTTDLSGYRKPS